MGCKIVLEKYVLLATVNSDMSLLEKWHVEAIVSLVSEHNVATGPIQFYTLRLCQIWINGLFGVFLTCFIYSIHVISIPVILNLSRGPETTQVFDSIGYTMLFVHIAHSLNKKWNDDPNKNWNDDPKKWNFDANKNGMMIPNKNGMMIPNKHGMMIPNKNGMMIPTKMEWWSQQKWNDDPNKNGMMIPNKNGMMIPTKMEWWSQQKWNDDPNKNGMMIPTKMEWWSQQKWNDDIKLVCFFFACID